MEKNVSKIKSPMKNNDEINNLSNRIQMKIIRFNKEVLRKKRERAENTDENLEKNLDISLKNSEENHLKEENLLTKENNKSTVLSVINIHPEIPDESHQRPQLVSSSNYPNLNKESSIICQLDDYKSSSQISDTTYKNDINLDEDQVSFKEVPSAEIKILHPEKLEEIKFALIKERFSRENENIKNCLNKTENILIEEDIEKLKENLHQSDVIEEKNLPFVKIERQEIILHKEILNFLKNNKDIKNKDNLIMMITISTSISLTIICFLSFISTKGEFTELLNDVILTKSTFFFVSVVIIFAFYYHTIYMYKTAVEEIYELVELSLKKYKNQPEFFLSETELQRFCFEELGYKLEVYWSKISPLIKTKLLKNSEINTTYFENKDMQIVTCWALKSE